MKKLARVLTMFGIALGLVALAASTHSAFASGTDNAMGPAKVVASTSGMTGGCFGCADDPSGSMCGGSPPEGYGDCAYTSGACDPAHAQCAECNNCNGGEGWGWYNYPCSYGCYETLPQDAAVAVKEANARDVATLMVAYPGRLAFDDKGVLQARACNGQLARSIQVDVKLRREIQRAMITTAVTEPNRFD